MTRGSTDEPWSVVSSRQIVDDEWLSLRADTCRRPNGEIIDPYYVFEYPNWVNIIAITNNHEVVLIRQYRHAVGRVLLEIPGGYMSASDVNAEAAARRELLEETGYGNGVFNQTGSVSANPASHNNVNYCFVAEGVDYVTDQQLDIGENIAVELVPVEKAIELAKGGCFFQALHVAAWFLAMSFLRIS